MRFDLRSVRRFLLLASVLMAAGLVRPWQGEAGESCRTKGETFARNSVARVYLAKGRYATPDLFGCSLKTGTSYSLEPSNSRSSGFSDSRLAGYYFLGDDTDDQSRDRSGATTSLFRRNLRTGRALRIRLPGSELSATDLVLKPNGSFAELRALDVGTDVEPNKVFLEVRRYDRRGRRVLARGFDIGSSSLTLRGSTLRWRQAGQVRRATLR